MFKRKVKNNIKENNNPYEQMPKFIKVERNHLLKPIIQVRDISQTYGKKQKKVIFENVNFDLFENECVAFLGPNGAGKTTMISIILGINKVQKGKINYLYEYKSKPYEELSVQFQDLHFPNSLTPNDLVKFSLNFSNKKINEEELKMAYEVFGIDEFANIKMHKLSGGQQQRVNVLISLLTKPRILFLDEFTTGLDIAIKSKIQAYIREYCIRNKITLVLISHDINTIEELATRVIILANKSIYVDAHIDDIIQEFGSVKNLIKQYIVS